MRYPHVHAFNKVFPRWLQVEVGLLLYTILRSILEVVVVALANNLLFWVSFHQMVWAVCDLLILKLELSIFQILSIIMSKWFLKVHYRLRIVLVERLCFIFAFAFRFGRWICCLRVSFHSRKSKFFTIQRISGVIARIKLILLSLFHLCLIFLQLEFSCCMHLLFEKTIIFQVYLLLIQRLQDIDAEFGILLPLPFFDSLIHFLSDSFPLLFGTVLNVVGIYIWFDKVISGSIATDWRQTIGLSFRLKLQIFSRNTLKGACVFRRRLYLEDILGSQFFTFFFTVGGYSFLAVGFVISIIISQLTFLYGFSFTSLIIICFQNLFNFLLPLFMISTLSVISS